MGTQQGLRAWNPRAQTGTANAQSNSYTLTALELQHSELTGWGLEQDHTKAGSVCQEFGEVSECFLHFYADLE